METLAVPILVAVITALIVVIVRGAQSSGHKVRDEMNAHVAALRVDIGELSRSVNELRGAGEERAALIRLLVDLNKA